jgi:hypothetical protein
LWIIGDIKGCGSSPPMISAAFKDAAGLNSEGDLKLGHALADRRPPHLAHRHRHLPGPTDLLDLLWALDHTLRREDRHSVDPPAQTQIARQEVCNQRRDPVALDGDPRLRAACQEIAQRIGPLASEARGIQPNVVHPGHRFAHLVLDGRGDQPGRTAAQHRDDVGRPNSTPRSPQ